MTLTKSYGMLALASYLILDGLCGVFDIHLGPLSVVVPLLALIAGCLILTGR